MTKINKPASFLGFLKNVAPWTPIDSHVLKNTKSSKLIVRKHEIICDLTGKKKTQVNLEKLFLEMQSQLDSYNLDSIGRTQPVRLETLKGVVENQTAKYKKKHWKITLAFRGWINGAHIDKASKDLLDKINKIRKLPFVDENQANKIDMTEKAALTRNEFQTTETAFCKSIHSAINNIDVLIQLRTNSSIKCSHPLLRAKGSVSLESCKAAFELVEQKALMIKNEFIKDPLHVLNDPLYPSTETGKNRRIARIYRSDDFSEYVKANTAAAAYYEELSALISALSKENVFDQNELANLDIPPDDPGFEKTPVAKLTWVVGNCFAPVMQRVMRHDLLMKALIENIPTSADEYDAMLEGAINAEIEASAMNFEKGYDNIHSKLFK